MDYIRLGQIQLVNIFQLICIYKHVHIYQLINFKTNK